MEQEKLLINNPKSNNSEDMSNKHIKSTDWLIRGVSKDQLEREKQKAIMSADLEMCHTECCYCGEIYTDYDATAEKMYAKGYRKQSEWISVDERLPEESCACLCTDGVAVGIVYYSDTNDFEVYTPFDTITHWMPLPEAPKMKVGD